VWFHPHIAVSQHEHAVPRLRQHVFEIRDFEITAGDARVDNERDVAVQPRFDEPARDRQGAVVPVAHTQHELQFAIILVGERAQVLVEARLRPMQRLQHAYGGLRGRSLDRTPGEAERRHGHRDEIGPDDDQY